MTDQTPTDTPGKAQLIERIDRLRAQAQDAIAGADDGAALEELRVRYLGRKAELPQLLRGVAKLAPEERGTVGKAANELRQALEQLIERRTGELTGVELQSGLAAEQIDVTLPGSPPQPVGRLHVLTQTMRELEDIFIGLGFTVLEGPEVETVHYNFDALNHVPTHPARARTDTFYVHRPGARGPHKGEGGTDASPAAADGTDAPPTATSGRLGEPADLVLRTHTSPMQIRAMEAHPPPLYAVIPGRVYRPDSDATHTPQFHQLEGLAVDEDITLGDLKGTLLAFARSVFGEEREVRLRPHFFPFTEPSVEVDVSCFHCDGRGHLRDGARCYLCKGEGWLEVLGAGEVDPNVYAYVPTTERNAPGYDPERVQGFAWGMGIERIAMLRHGIPDLRLYYENDLRFLEQFA
jgi:phenylalanyl-tRNA synthetase alpha chain